MSKKLKSGDNLVAQSTGGDSIGIKWIMVIYFCSGVCSLIDEVVWVRLLKLTLGNTEYASSIVVSVFMGGLALGALIMGRYADRVKKRLRLYAILEMLAAVSALSLPFVLRIADGVYRWFFLKYQTAPTALIFVQIIVSAGILLVPTMVMGSTLPLLSRYITSLQNRVGPLVGKLYALNTLGAALGCFLAGFVLIRIAGVMGALYAAACINMLVALGGWVLSRSHDISGGSEKESTVPEKRSMSIKKAAGTGYYLLMPGVFASGLISIGYELVWMRSIVIPLGGYTYVFSAVLTTYLFGNVIGAWIGSRISKRLRNPAVGFGISLSCLGILGICYIPWLSLWIDTVHNRFLQNESLLNVYGFQGIVLPLLYSIFLFLLPSIAMGIGFPLALQAWSNYRHKVGETTGLVYGVNTIGAVLGGIITGFLLIPLAGTQLSITILGLSGIWLGCVMVQVFAKNTSITNRIVYYTIAVVLTLAAVTIPSDLFKKKIVTTPDSVTIYVEEGITTTVAIKKDIEGNLLMTSNGVYIAGDDVHRTAQKMLGHLGILLNKNSRDVLSVGFGSGETVACVAQHNLNTIDCVEIAPEIVQMGLRYFKHINLGEQLNQKVNMIYMDAKNYLHLTNRTYDVILNDADLPTHSGSAPIFAKEHFQNTLEHLNTRGLVFSKLHLANITASSFNSILGTFVEVFPHVTIWFPTTRPLSFFYIVGSKQKQMFSLKHIDDNLKINNVRKSLKYLNIRDNIDILSCYIGDENDIKRYLHDYHVNSDYTPFVEFNLDQIRHGMQEELFPQFIEKVRRNSLANHIDWTGISQDEKQMWLDDYALTYNVSTYLLKLFREQDIILGLQYILDGLKLMPEHEILQMKKESTLSYYKEKMLSNRQFIRGIDGLLQKRPYSGTVWLVKSWILRQANRLNEALIAGEKAVEYDPGDAVAYENLAWISIMLKQTDKAIVYLCEAIRLNPNEPLLHWNLALTYTQTGQSEKAISPLRKMLEIQPRNEDVRLFLGDLLYQQGKKDDAVKEYREALKINPNNIKARNKLNSAMSQ